MQEDAPQIILAAELAATFGKGGDWDTLDQSGMCAFSSRIARQRAGENRAFDGHASRWTALPGRMRRTTAEAWRLIRSRGYPGNRECCFHISSATESPAGAPTQSSRKASALGDAINLGSKARPYFRRRAGFQARPLPGTWFTPARGSARDQCSTPDKIELWREEKKMQAAGHGLRFLSGFRANGAPQFGKPSKAGSTAKSSGSQTRPARADALEYSRALPDILEDQGGALEGGVTAQSQEGSLASPTLDAFLSSGSIQSGPNVSRGPVDHARASRLSWRGYRPPGRPLCMAEQGGTYGPPTENCAFRRKTDHN